MSGSVLAMLVSHLRATVEALELHLAATRAAPLREQRAPTDDEVKVVSEKIAEMMATAGWGEPWNTAAVIQALDEYRRRRDV